MASLELVKYFENAKKVHKTDGASLQLANAMFQAGNVAIKGENDVPYGLMILEEAKKVSEKFVRKQVNGSVWELEKYGMDNKLSIDIINTYYEILKLEAPYRFESFVNFMEKKRPQDKRFYFPRKKSLKIVCDDLQRLEDTDLKFYGLSMPSRVGKSTICIFFLAWIGLKRPNSHSAMGGHSGMLADGFYDELLNLLTTQEYSFDELFHDIHPDAKLLTDKSADKHIITLDKPDRFATFTCRGIDGTWTGDVDISDGGYLYVDDLVRDREHSLSPQRMENTFQEYLNKMVDRKIGAKIRPHGGAKELMVGTLWNVLDPLERMSKMYKDDPQYLFRRIPALNEKDESNFDYLFNKGFSTAYYHEMRERLDKPEWMAKYQQKPFLREGIVFPADELRYFNGILPDGEHRTVAVVDVAWGGGDHLSMPIGALYENGDCYIFDWVFNDGAKEVTIPLVTGQIVNNGIRQIRFEGNTGGEMYQAYVDEQLQAFNYKCSTESKKAPVKSTKMEKIIAYSGDIKRKFIFLQSKRPSQAEIQRDAELGITRYRRNDEYQNAMDELVTFVKVGKNDHDDAVDSLAQLVMLIDGDEDIAEVKAMMNPFRGYWRK